MKKKKPDILSNVSERDKMLLFVLGAILVLAAAFFFIFSPTMKKADEVKEENKELSAYVVELNQKIAHEDEKKQEIITFNNNRQDIMKKFPSGMTYEKAIAILADLEDKTKGPLYQGCKDFALERNKGLESIIGNIYQSFG